MSALVTDRPSAPDAACGYDPNPLVSSVIRRGRAGVGLAPELFESGSIPPYLASGMDPMLLTRVPAAARHPLARATTVCAARQIVARYGGADAVRLAATDFADDEGNLRYTRRVRAWARSSHVDLPLGVDAWVGSR